MTGSDNLRFRDREITFENGSQGENVDVPSASPLNYHQLLSASGTMRRVVVDGKLFLPPKADSGGRGLPAVVVAPGSLGVADSHLAHAETLTDLGIASFVLDSFGERNVTSTVANQAQFSFAASALDVLAAWKVLAERSDIDAERIGAQGHSRGGSAVMTAANRRFADAVVGRGAGLVAVLAAYPWSGHQFIEAGVGRARVHVVMGDRDEWCSPMQVQAHCHTINLTGGNATMRLVGGAQHSFDRGTPVVDVPEAKISPAAPTAYIVNDGAFVHPLERHPDPTLVDRDLMVYALKAGFGRVGARIGSAPGEAQIFRDEMVRFWREL